MVLIVIYDVFNIAHWKGDRIITGLGGLGFLRQLRLLGLSPLRGRGVGFRCPIGRRLGTGRRGRK